MSVSCRADEATIGTISDVAIEATRCPAVDDQSLQQPPTYQISVTTDTTEPAYYLEGPSRVDEATIGTTIPAATAT